MTNPKTADLVRRVVAERAPLGGERAPPPGAAAAAVGH